MSEQEKSQLREDDSINAIRWMIERTKMREKECMLSNPCPDDTPGECDGDCEYHINENDPDGD